MNKCMLSLAASAVAASALAAVPEVSGIVATQDSASRKVTVNYTLANEPAIVTLSVETNSPNGWVSIGDENLTHVAGDANKIVETGARSLTWVPHKAWPNQFVNDGNIRVGVKAWATNAPPEIMAVNLKAAKTVRYYSSAAALPGGVTNDLYKTDILVMRLIPAANVTWTMGSPTTEAQRIAARETSHEVTLTEDYWIGVYELTQRQWELVMGARPSSHFNADEYYATRPVENVGATYVGMRGASDSFCWPQAGHKVADYSFLGKLRAHSGLDGFELPTDAQWEFACRAGNGAAIYTGKEIGGNVTSANLATVARYKGNDGFVNGSTSPDKACSPANGTAKVGSYEPNAWGLYDMLGNVYERCLDWYTESPVGLDPEVGPASGSDRVIRGGSWNQPAADCRCANRGGWGPSATWAGLGVRIACLK